MDTWSSFLKNLRWPLILWYSNALALVAINKEERIENKSFSVYANVSTSMSSFGCSKPSFIFEFCIR